MDNNSTWWEHMPTASSFPALKTQIPNCNNLASFNLILSVIVINAVLVLLAASLNALVILMFIKTVSLRETPSNVLLLGLAISDFSVGFIVQPLFCIMIFAESTLGKTADISQIIGKLFHYTSYYLSWVSLSILTGVNIDRFLAVHLHLRYRELVTTKRYGITLACIWIASSVVFLKDIFTIPVFYILVGTMLCGILLIDLYLVFKISRVIHQHSVQIQAQQQSVQQPLDMPRYKKSVNTMYFVMGAFILCYFPYLGTLIMEILKSSYQETLSYLCSSLSFFSPVTTTLILSNSVINPIIYCWRIKEMRNAVKKLIQRA